MKPLSITRLAAALLLAPLGFLAQPAVAQQAAIVAQGVDPSGQPLTIRRLWLQRTGLHVGAEVSYLMHANPGAQAVVDIPGVARGLPMGEVMAGMYTVKVVIQPRDNPSAFGQAVATVQQYGQRVSARVDPGASWYGDLQGRGEQRADDWRAEDRWARARRRGDQRPPEITALSPAHGERVGDRGRTHISARISDEGSGIAPAAVQLHVDGRDVSDRVRIEGDAVRYREDLAPGRHTAELLVRDRAGNLSRRSWRFEVVERGYGWGDQRTDGWGGWQRY